MLVGCNPADLQALTGSERTDGILFYDDFSNPRSGWLTWEDEKARIAYQDGGLLFQIMTSQFDYWSLARQSFSDAILAVEAQVVAGPRNNDFGLICRYQNPQQFYAFIISSDGYAGIAVMDGQGYQILGGEALQYFSQLDRDENRYLIRADCIGSHLALYVNQEKLLEVEDYRYNSGDVGLLAGTYEEAGVEILFDNFYVLEP